MMCCCFCVRLMRLCRLFVVWRVMSSGVCVVVFAVACMLPVCFVFVVFECVCVNCLGCSM